MALEDPIDHSAPGISEHSFPKFSSQQVSQDVPPPRAGPGFIRLGSTIYRLEMLLITLAILSVLFYWRLIVVKDLNVPLTIFWIVWPDLGSFIPIGLAARGSKDWPSWGPWLYNSLHTFLVWIPVFAIWSAATGSLQWPLLGWASHITADRSVGYYLRAKSPKNRPEL